MKEINIFYKSFWRIVFFLMDIVNKNISLKKILINYGNNKDTNFIRMSLTKILNDYFLITHLVSNFIDNKNVNEKIYYALKVITMFYINNEIINNIDKIFNEYEVKIVREYYNYLEKEFVDREEYISKYERYYDILKYSVPKFYINEVKKVIPNEYDKYLEYIKNKDYKPAIRVLDDLVIDFLKEYGIKIKYSGIPHVYFIEKGKVNPDLIFENNMKITYTDFSSLYSIYSLYELIVENFDEVKILDAFSAPGSKISYLYQLLKENGIKFDIIGIDINEERLKKMKKFMNLYNLNFKVKKMDFLDINSKFDVILMDIPCSNSGTLWQNPDQRIKQTLYKMIKNYNYQDKLIKKAKNLEPKLIYYATCSIYELENEINVNKFLDKYKILEKNPLKIDVLYTNGYRFFPHKNNTQAFFYTFLIKKTL